MLNLRTVERLGPSKSSRIYQKRWRREISRRRRHPHLPLCPPGAVLVIFTASTSQHIRNKSAVNCDIVARFLAHGKRTDRSDSRTGSRWQSRCDAGDEDCADCTDCLLCNVADLPVLWSFGVLAVFGVAGIFTSSLHVEIFQMIKACEGVNRTWNSHLNMAMAEHGTIKSWRDSHGKLDESAQVFGLIRKH